MCIIVIIMIILIITNERDGVTSTTGSCNATTAVKTDCRLLRVCIPRTGCSRVPNTGICETNTPFGRAFALQSSGRTCYPPPDSVL